jgi:hypothetical protein
MIPFISYGFSRKVIQDSTHGIWVFNPGSSLTFSLCPPKLSEVGCSWLITFAKAKVIAGSTSDKQTSKGLFICNRSFRSTTIMDNCFSAFRLSELFSPARAGLRDELFCIRTF